ncbi:hypothetical protein OJ998_22140 [Solirubrobacter taibaiensis]|nr:hypothetical protein [Solirubrobacter taibaiensis]
MTALASNLTATVTVADPDVVGPLAVFPLIVTHPRTLRYQAFAQGGVTVHELEEASVNDLLVSNALDVPVLLYEGEEVLGAQQNRTFDVSVLVPAGTELQVPVSCVEAQRWDGGRHEEAFTPAPQAAHPELRRAKSEQMRERLAAGQEARAEQSAVWSMVAAKAQRHGVASPTGALHDVFDGHRDKLTALSSRIVARPDQVGMLAAIAGRFIVVDHISDPAAFAALHAPLVQGYALDAVEAKETDPPSTDNARQFLRGLSEAEVGFDARMNTTVGLGTLLPVVLPIASGTALVNRGECITLTAFAADQPRTHIRRPSQRRRG